MALLLGASADPFSADAEGNTALHLIGSQLGDPRNLEPEKARNLFRQFVTHGLPINGRDAKGETPVFAFLASQGRDRDDGTGNEHENKRQRAALQLLTDGRADFLAVNDAGETLLHIVAATGRKRREGAGGALMIERFRWLLQRGLDPMAEDLSSVHV